MPKQDFSHFSIGFKIQNELLEFLLGLSLPPSPYGAAKNTKAFHLCMEEEKSALFQTVKTDAAAWHKFATFIRDLENAVQLIFSFKNFEPPTARRIFAASEFPIHHFSWETIPGGEVRLK